ncbi:2-succinyl-5-enolpyruvyl-6-hydroxy-3-cyclohexene-1-carboxylic-acid synthase [Vagococcus zengguangii]|uniref:2-succinyl-5-enolpyruvyl-6-hydroxy-3-cyclohexene-1-carboxylate synthase n=1 Tax=Vagococcus zengguangii TaxID=2571750 RepID=A0A4D7CP76_9ENTE|nr:2-succinyl-5-enolpyruvyl-6-hydroxy-3-cyclohexene-1-carboxylic-acid synthase [Vagococcus zengguangii]QCI85895.1 2-succinyl-5-enolpyruvyl-6-hydroxy-3-cyclohexene-1-carboxylic-acid synthase [Vagococcus zengguangii]TLG78385.1 2-succinyl-5-enolpyruvyl-6-hydroxy-3-cyclohexene-1-carboxylic-acid synthase [Vagococcus zengguangii]
MTHQSDITDYLQSFIEGLVVGNVNYAVISPGSRSTPLSLLLHREPNIKTFVEVDERSAAFFALGLAKATLKPVVLVCTSGTAAANYFPAICEAQASGVPLIVLTTDRPHELRQVAASQTMDQLNLFNQQVKFFAEMALPEATDTMRQYAFWQGRRMPEIATQIPSGPVHLNFPLREPLLPDLSPKKQHHPHYISHLKGQMQLDDNDLKYLADMLNRQAGVFVLGGGLTVEETALWVKLAIKLNWPIMGDPLSNLDNCGIQSDLIMSQADLFISELTDEKPTSVFRVGRLPVSKNIMLWLKGLSIEDTIVIEVDEKGYWEDSLRQGRLMITSNSRTLVKQLLTSSYPSEAAMDFWTNRWINAQKQTQKIVKEHLQSIDLSEITASRLVHETMPKDGNLFLSNSMAIRHVERFSQPTKKAFNVYGNRGVNGIDGIISTALGICAANPDKQNVLLIGDLATYHDMNGLQLAKAYQLSLTIVLLNNNGGGIFSYLSQNQLEASDFEPLFGTPLEMDFSLVAQLYGADYYLADSLDGLKKRLMSTQHSPHFQIIEVQDNRERNVQLLDDIMQAIKGSL